MLAMHDSNINFISYNVKEIQNYYKRNKIFNYLSKNVNPNVLIFLQETHSSSEQEKTILRGSSSFLVTKVTLVNLTLMGQKKFPY